MEVDDATDGGKGEFVVEVKFFFVGCGTLNCVG